MTQGLNSRGQRYSSGPFPIPTFTGVSDVPFGPLEADFYESHGIEALPALDISSVHPGDSGTVCPFDKGRKTPCKIVGLAQR